MKRWLVLGGAAVGALLAPVAVVAGVTALGFGAGGIVAGSTATTIMSTLGSGSVIVGTLQSVGAAGSLKCTQLLLCSLFTLNLQVWASLAHYCRVSPAL